MEMLFVFLRFALAGVFAFAGVMKLRDLERTRQDFEALGLPAWIASALSFRLPIIELAVAVMLLIEPLAAIGAACALVLLSVFTAIITMNLLRGRRPACACFGALTESAISWKSVGRNLALMAIAGVQLAGIGLLQGFRFLTVDALIWGWALLAATWLFTVPLPP
jgi:hypothetical protein